MPRTAVVLLAAGSGSRVGAEVNKVLLPLLGRSVLDRSLRTVAALQNVASVVVVHRAEDAEQVSALTRSATLADARLVEGGATRHASEWNALQVLSATVDGGDIDVVAIHDTARPLATAELFDAVIRSAHEYGGAIPVRWQPGLISTKAGHSTRAGRLVAVQTPQAFRAPDLLAAYRAAQRDGFEGTDTAACVERYTDLTVRGIPSPATNIKITFPEDVALAGRLLSRRDPGASTP
jgi:2-C-methyl-D-erythritol 4-phosphate cytidylyltransferase